MSNEKTDYTQNRPLVDKGVRAVDFTETLTDLNAQRTARGLSTTSWSTTPAADGDILVQHMNTLRTATAGLVKYGSSDFTFTDSSITSATDIRATHMEEVRQVNDDARNNARCYNCSTACVRGCTVNCNTTCTGGCTAGAACYTMCTGGCGAGCWRACYTNCTGCSSCWWWLGGNCGACNVNCTGGCVDQNCITACDTGCNVFCTASCSVWCSTSCTGTCNANCVTDCSQSCYNTCSVSCRSACANSSRKGTDAAAL